MVVYVVFLSALCVSMTYVYAGQTDDSSRELTEFLEKSANLRVWPRRLNPVHVVVVFTKFKDEAPAYTKPPYWAETLYDGAIGSVPDFFERVTFGKYKVTGEHLPKVYEMPHDSTYYDNVFDYSLDITKMLDEDPDVDFSHFDNDGPDGIPSSDDDDGFVDYMVLMPRTRPYDFIQQLATGVMYLGLKDAYRTNDRSSIGERIQVDRTSGSISVAANRNQATGTIIGELTHAFGSVDLMDKIYVNPPNDSAGIGFWGLLGRGALGWGGYDGPVGPCAYNRILMNSAGYNNSNLVDLYGIHQGIRMKDVGHPDGKIYRLWINQTEYFLLEFRSNSGNNYYDRNLPNSGILIYHVDETESNSTELNKLCDVECADGRYTDKGYPLGLRPDPIKGGDNLDFWAHDRAHTVKFAGNEGDASDVFDGVNYTKFGTETNPNSYSKRTQRPTGIEIFNIRRDGDEMVFDCYIPPIPDRTPGEAPRIGMAFQRSSTNSSYENFLDWKKELYIVNFGFRHMGDALVTVTKDTLYVDPLEFNLSYDVQKQIEKRLMPDNRNTWNSRIVRRHVSVDTFNGILNKYGMLPEDINSDRQIRWVQKITAQSEPDALPVTAIGLFQNYPNPFNNQTTISYVLSTGGSTALEVYNILGQRVMLLDRGFVGAGHHSIRLDAAELPSGMYLYRLRGKSFSQINKFTVIK